jgi:hypothetical protein
MAYLKRIRNRALKLRGLGLSAERISEKLSKENSKRRFDEVPTPKTIRNWINAANKIQIAREKVHLEVADIAAHQASDPAVVQARAEHFADIRNLLAEQCDPETLRGSRWYDFHLYIEKHTLFPYVLQHCPSIDLVYQLFRVKREACEKSKKSVNETSPLEKEFNSLKEDERNLYHTIQVSLLSSEYLNHNCDWCP